MDEEAEIKLKKKKVAEKKALAKKKKFEEIKKLQAKLLKQEEIEKLQDKVLEQEKLEKIKEMLGSTEHEQYLDEIRHLMIQVEKLFMQDCELKKNKFQEYYCHFFQALP